MKKEYLRGLGLGVPIALGYFPASFSFGIMAISFGFTWWQAVLISALTLTSAGQFSGIGTMQVPGAYGAMALSQLTINIRYSVMGISIAQKLSPNFGSRLRVLLSFFLTDEIFAVANMEREVSPIFFLGVATTPYFGWFFGTLAGSLLGAILPPLLMNAFSVALYGLFIAAVVPKAKAELPIAAAVGLSIVFGCILYYVPTGLSKELSVCAAAVAAAALASCFFTMGEEDAQ